MDKDITKYNGSIICLFWHWRRIIAATVLITFTSSLLSPAFGSDLLLNRIKNGVAGRNVVPSKNSRSKGGDIWARKKPSTNLSIGSPESLIFKGNTLEPVNARFFHHQKYLPYFEFGGAKYFNQSANVAGIYDLFIPLLQNDDNLFFTDLRIFDRSGSSFEGNVHFGFRKLYPASKTMLGVYCGYDYKRSKYRHNYNQVMCGFEYWQNRWFVGGNIYKPFWQTSRLVEVNPSYEPNDRSITITKNYEKALPGFDGEVGFSFSENLTGYFGGYYFHGGDASSIIGPKARVVYDYRVRQGRILGVIDGISIEGGVQYDRPRKVNAYLGIKLKIGLNQFDKNSNLFGFERHMTDLVRRDPDVVIAEKKKQNKFYQTGARGFYLDDYYGTTNGKYDNLSIAELLSEFGLSSGASWQDVEKKWREYAKLYHPDRNMGKSDQKAKEKLFIHYSNLHDVLRKKMSSRNGKNNREDNSQETKSQGFDNMVFDQAVAKYEKSNERHSLKDFTPVFHASVPKVKKSNAFIPQRFLSGATESEPGANDENKIASLKQVLSSLETESIKLDRFTVNYLDQMVIDDKNSLDLIIQYAKDQSVAAKFLVNLVKDDGFSIEAKVHVIDKIIDDIEIRSFWRDNCDLDILSALLPYDNNSHDLGLALVGMHDKSGYRADSNVLSNYEKLLDNPVTRNDAAKFISSSVAGMFTSNLQQNFVAASEHLNILLTNTRRLSRDLVGKLFNIFYSNQDIFNALMVNILAEDNMLPFDLLNILVLHITKIQDPASALFIACRLIQNRVILPSAVLKNFLIFLLSDDRRLQDLAINLYRELTSNNRYELSDIIPDMLDALVLASPRLSQAQLSKVADIFRDIAVISPESIAARAEVQQQVIAAPIKNLVPRIKLSMELLDHITISNVDDLELFFKENWLAQNQMLLELAAQGFTKISEFKQVSWDKYEQDKLSLLELVHQPSSEFLLVLGGETMILTRKQRRRLKEQLQGFSWDLFGQLSKIKVVDYRDLEKFLLFIQEADLPEQKISRVIGEGGVISLEDFYKRLLYDRLNDFNSNNILTDDASLVLHRSIKVLLDDLDWSADCLYRLLKKYSQSGLANLIAELEKLVDYEVDLSLVDRYGRNAYAILDVLPTTEIAAALNSLIRDNHFYVIKDLDYLLEELKVLNPNNQKILDLIATGYFKETIKKIEKFIVDGLPINGEVKPLAAWNKENVSRWLREHSVIDDDSIAEFLAVFSQMAHNTILGQQFYPRIPQHLSALIAFKCQSGCLLQVNMGEGKTLIIDLLSALKVLMHRDMDIVTSSGVLARRDAKKQAAFYRELDISVGHNTDSRKPGEAKQSYTNQVIYGDILNFAGDALADITDNVKFGRGFDTLAVDEVDHLLVDQIEMKVQLTKVRPGLDILGQLLIYIYGMALTTISNIYQGKEQCYAKLVADSAQPNFNVSDVQYNLIPLENVSDCHDFVRATVSKYAEDKLFAFYHPKDQRDFVVPHHLEKFVQDQLPHWIDSIFLSNSYREKVDYIINYDNENIQKNFLIVSPIDQATGVIQNNLHWSDGLHQFLQLKNRLVLLPESIVSIFMSYFGFFDKYDGRIYGFSGTLYYKFLQELLYENYGVEIYIIPTFLQRDFTWFEPKFLLSRNAWEKSIINIAERTILGRNRAGLIILDSIKKVENLRQLLQEPRYPGNRIFTYGTGAKDDEQTIARELQAGDIIIATNLAGRGTDLKLSSAVIKNGGLHVIVGDYPLNLRSQDQAFARGGRQDEPGSGQYVVCAEDFATSCQNFTCLEDELNLREQQKLGELRQSKLVLDNFFNLYVELVREFDSPTGYKLSCIKADNNLTLEPNVLYLSQVGDAIGLQVIKDKEIKYLNITELIAAIAPYEYRHIKTVLSNARLSVSSLSKQDSEVLHFIAAYHGYIKNNDIYNRVIGAYQKEIVQKRSQISSWLEKGLRGIFGGDYNSSKSAEEKYLLDLLANDPKFKDLAKNGEDVSGEKILEWVKLRKLFYLWVADRGLYNNEQEIRQLEEYWGFEFKKYVDLFLKYERGELAPEQNKLSMLQKVQEELNGWFRDFRQEMLKKWGAKDFIQNGAYLVLKAWQYVQIYFKQPILDDDGNRSNQPLDAAIEFLNRAIELDDFHSWTAHNALSYVRLIRDSSGIHIEDEKNMQAVYEIKKNFISDVTATIDKLKNEVAGLEAALSYLLANNLVNYTDPLATQLLGNIELYREIIKVRQKTIDLASTASGTEGIRVGGLVDMSEMANKINMTQLVLEHSSKYKNLQRSGGESLEHLAGNLEFAGEDVVVQQILGAGGLLIEVEKYQLEKPPKDFFGNLVQALVGGLSIFLGFALMPLAGSGVFLNTFLSSLIISGIGDVISSLASLAIGIPTDLHELLKAKSFSVGISLATAGMLHFIDSIKLVSPKFFDGIRGTSTKVLGDKLGFLTEGVLLQGAALGASTILAELGKKTIDEGDITASAKSIVESILNIFDLRELLRKIFVTDWFSNNSKLQELLYVKIQEGVNEYGGRFHGDWANVGTGMASDMAGRLASGATGILGLGNVFNAATKLTLGAIKNNNALGNMAQDMKSAIISVSKMVLKSGSIMEEKLKQDFGKEIGTKIVSVLLDTKHIVHGEINYNECGKLRDLQLDSDLALYKDGMVEECEAVKGLFTAEFSSAFDKLKNYSVKLFTAALVSSQKQDFVRPVADALGQAAAPLIVDQLKTYLDLIRSNDKVINVRDNYKQDLDQDEETPKPAAKSGLRQEQVTADNVKKSVSEAKYIVKEGDNLSKIAKRLGTTSARLKKLNPQIKNYNLIYPGQEIIVGAPVIDSHAIVYPVVGGEPKVAAPKLLNKICKWGVCLEGYADGDIRAVRDGASHADGAVRYAEKPSLPKDSFVILDGKDGIDQTKLAWWVVRYKNVLSDSSEYFPLLTPGSKTKHWGIQLADGSIVGFFPDRENEKGGVIWDETAKSSRKYYARMQAYNLLEVGFNNEIIRTALVNIQNKWTAAGIKYEYLKYDCHVFIYQVIEEYRRLGGVIYHKMATPSFRF